MSPDDVFAAYEALVARALDWARGMGRFEPLAPLPDARWLTRWEGGVELHWLDAEGDENLALIPVEAFAIADGDFAAWILIRRIESDDKIDQNAAILRGMVRRLFDQT